MGKVKFLILFVSLMLMTLQSHSQTTLKTKPQRVTTYINQNGDTMIVMKSDDGKFILESLLKCEYNDSLLNAYIVKDSIQSNTITLKDTIIKNMTLEKTNLQAINKNLEEVIVKEEKVVKIKDEIIESQKKEIRKQKVLKIIGFTGSVVLPILTLLALI